MNRLIKYSFLFILIFVLSSCTLDLSGLKVYNVKSLERVLQKYNKADCIHYTYFASIYFEDGVQTIGCETKIVNINTEPSMHMNLRIYGKTINAYYVDGYLCNENYKKYDILEVPDFEINDEKPLPDFDFDELVYEFEVKVEDEVIFYNLNVNGDDLKSFVERIIGETLDDVELTMSIEILVDEETKKIKSMEYDISIDEVKVEMLMFIKGINDDVELEIPNDVLREIEKYKEK